MNYPALITSVDGVAINLLGKEITHPKTGKLIIGASQDDLESVFNAQSVDGVHKLIERFENEPKQKTAAVKRTAKKEVKEADKNND